MSIGHARLRAFYLSLFIYYYIYLYIFGCSLLHIIHTHFCTSIYTELHIFCKILHIIFIQSNVGDGIYDVPL